MSNPSLTLLSTIFSSLDLTDPLILQSKIQESYQQFPSLNNNKHFLSKDQIQIVTYRCTIVHNGLLPQVFASNATLTNIKTNERVMND